MVEFLGLALHQDGQGVCHQAVDAHHDHDGDEDGADGVSDHPVEGVDEEGGDDDPEAAQRVGQNVEDHLKARKVKIQTQTRLVGGQAVLGRQRR